METIHVLKIEKKYGNTIFTGTRKQCVEFLKHEMVSGMFRNYQLQEVNIEDLHRAIEKMNPRHERTL